jgi:hypothetical protein
MQFRLRITKAYALSSILRLSLIRLFPLASFVRAVRYGLNLPVFLLKLALHLKVDLSFALDTLLFHVTDYALMHGLGRQSAWLRWKLGNRNIQLYRPPAGSGRSKRFQSYPRRYLLALPLLWST